MAHADVLTEDEYRRFQPSQLILRSLEECRLRFGLRRDETNVLDFGCGRGRCLCFLHEQGYNVFGVDSDVSALERGAELLTRHQVDVDRKVKLVGPVGPLPFPDEMFHFVLSDQVLEHVESLEPVISELARVTRNGGLGYHRFPPPWTIVEPHVRMPLVHWLPKTRARKGAIALWLLLGVDPGWTREGSVAARAEVYYRYTIECTHYRSPWLVRRQFERGGFSTSYPGLDRRESPGSRSTPAFKRLLGRWRRLFAVRFRHVELLATKAR